MKLTLALILLAGSAAWAADSTPMDVKTGVWETTTTTQTTGAIPEAVLSNLPPDQRARIEAAMKQQFGQPKTTTHRACVKKEDLGKPLFDQDQKTCKATVVSASSTKRESRVECKEEQGIGTGTLRIEATNSENVKITGNVAFNAGGQGFNTAINGTAKWISAVCTGKEQ